MGDIDNKLDLSDDLSEYNDFKTTHISAMRDEYYFPLSNKQFLVYKDGKYDLTALFLLSAVSNTNFFYILKEKGIIEMPYVDIGKSTKINFNFQFEGNIEISYKLLFKVNLYSFLKKYQKGKPYCFSSMYISIIKGKDKIISINKIDGIFIVPPLLRILYPDIYNPFSEEIELYKEQEYNSIISIGDYINTNFIYFIDIFHNDIYRSSSYYRVDKDFIMRNLKLPITGPKILMKSNFIYSEDILSMIMSFYIDGGANAL